MYQQHPEIHALAAKDRYAAMLTEAAMARLVNASRTHMFQHVAHRFGKSLIRLGARLIRYGKVNQTVVRA